MLQEQTTSSTCRVAGWTKLFDLSLHFIAAGLDKLKWHWDDALRMHPSARIQA